MLASEQAAADTVTRRHLPHVQRRKASPQYRRRVAIVTIELYWEEHLPHRRSSCHSISWKQRRQCLEEPDIEEAKGISNAQEWLYLTLSHQ